MEKLVCFCCQHNK